MAGSYKHIVNRNGNLRNNESFVQHIENLGDAYEAVEELYGMVWYLAREATAEGNPAEAVERARQNYAAGLDIARLWNGDAPPDTDKDAHDA